MDTFLVGFLLGVAFGQALLVGLARLGRLPFMQRLLPRLGRWATTLFWTGVERLLGYLDELLARKREREADQLGSPNLVGPTAQGAATHTSGSHVT
jgi:hypothetical protein